MMIICKTYGFDAAHHLTEVPEHHPCSFVHGHSYRVDIALESDALEKGMVLDFHQLDDIMRPILAQFDHSDLNDTLENPTAELISIWIAQNIVMLIPQGIRLLFVRVWETEKAYAEYRPTG